MGRGLGKREPQRKSRTPEQETPGTGEDMQVCRGNSVGGQARKWEKDKGIREAEEVGLGLPAHQAQDWDYILR